MISAKIKLFLLIIFLVDLGLIHYFLFNLWSRPLPLVPPSADSCGSECQKYINSKISESKVILPPPIPTEKPIATTRTKVRSVSYLPISTTGSTGIYDWVSLPATDFYFDIGDYPGLKEIYFEANGHLFNGNGIAYFRLYDATHSVFVTGSNLETKQQKDSALTSAKVLFAPGRNLIQVQAKTLTADTAVFTSGRLKIIVEN